MGFIRQRQKIPHTPKQTQRPKIHSRVVGLHLMEASVCDLTVHDYISGLTYSPV